MPTFEIHAINATMLHQILIIWFNWVEQWGYLGVFILMAMESSIIPVPSEVVLPPAAFWASQGRMSLAGIILAGTAGSYVGSAISYWVSYLIGRPIVHRFGRFILLTPKKMDQAESWIGRFGSAGVFFARLLPGLRHLISIPAGLLKMNFSSFSLATTTGAFIWCCVLSWFGQQVLGGAPDLLKSPEAMVGVIKSKLIWFVAAVLFMGLLYIVSVTRLSLKNSRSA